MAINVKLTKHYLKNGKISLYLSFYPYYYDIRPHKTIRMENLKLWMIANPKTTLEKRHNAEVEQLAFAILSKRMIQIRNEEYGFLDTTRKKESFLEYFKKQAEGKQTKWNGCYQHFNRFCNGVCTFGMINEDFCNRFRDYLLKEARSRRTNEIITRNSASGYMGIFRCLLRQAYVEKYFDTDITDFFEGIEPQKTYKEYLTTEEFQSLAATECRFDVLKRIAIFGVFCGMRISDLESLRWEQIVKAPDGGWCIRKEILKSGRRESVFISDDALSYCGERSTGLVFKDFKRSMLNAPLKQWLRDAGIDKHITFHCLRHTNATLMLENNIDIYTISHQLTHANVQTTQIYMEVVDEKKRQAANAISLKPKLK